MTDPLADVLPLLCALHAHAAGGCEYAGAEDDAKAIRAWLAGFAPGTRVERAAVELGEAMLGEYEERGREGSER